MKRIFQILFLAANLIGYLTFALSRIFKDSLSDFALGFCEGFSITLILIGFSYMIYCFAKKQNPYKKWETGK